MNLLPIDHVVLAVKSLPVAKANFQSLGFTVCDGGRHANGFSHNAMIFLEDGSFLELFAFMPGIKTKLLRFADRIGLMNARKQRAENGYMPRFMKGLQGREGFIDFAISAQSFDQEIGRMLDAGVEIGPTGVFGRKKPDGSYLSWQLAFPTDLVLPFMMSNYDPPRKLEKNQVKHANECVGIAQLSRFTTKWEHHLALYKQIFSINPIIDQEQKSACFRLGSQQFLLKETKDTAKHEWIELDLYADRITQARTLKLELCHGANICLLPKLP